MHGINQFRVVVGIDFGTSRSGYAYAFTEDKRIVGRTEWPAQPVPYSKTLTHLLYTPDNEVEAWGYEARVKLAELRKSKSAREYSFFRNFKMSLREHGGDASGGPVITNKSGRKFSVLNLVADYLRFLKELALRDVKDATSGLIQDNEILWCLTVPAIWTEAEKQLMRQAARQGGLVNSDEDVEERLLLVLEPEAAAILCQEREQSQLALGTRFMVVDCGGGTVDITTHEILQNRDLKEIAEGTGGAYGSTYVDHNFLEYLKTKLTPEAHDIFHNEEPIEYLEMMADWERTKCSYDPQGGGKTTYFPIRAKLYKLLITDFPEVLKRLAEEQDGDDDSIHLSDETMERIFSPVLDGVVTQVRKQLDKLSPEGCDILFLVGGFSKSPLLRKRIQDNFGSKVKRIVLPAEPGAVIVEGAVAFGLNPSLIRARRARLTYGCAMESIFESGVDPESKKVWREDRKNWYCSDRFDTFVTAGQLIEINESVTRSYVATSNNQTAMRLRFFAAMKKHARYTDESGLTEIGGITVNMPDTTGGINRTVNVTMYFGRTQIQVKAKEQNTGKEYTTLLRFSSTYSSEDFGE